MSIRPTRPAAREREAREEFFELSREHTDYLCAELAEGRLLVNTADGHVGRALFVKQGRGDIGVLARSVMTIEALLGEAAIADRTFIDVGANIGSTTVSALISHPFSDALALEPEPENFLTLRLNLILNGLDDRCRPLQQAASNATSELDFVVYGSRSGKHEVAKPSGPELGANAQLVRVPATTLDSLAGEAYEPMNTGLLWIDAESYEATILEGATALTERGTPVLFECDPRGLKERGELGKLCSIIENSYSHFSPMRASREPGRPRYELRTTGEFREFADALERFTDIIVLQLKPDQVPERSLGEVLAAASRKPSG